MIVQFLPASVLFGWTAYVGGGAGADSVVWFGAFLVAMALASLRSRSRYLRLR